MICLDTRPVDMIYMYVWTQRHHIAYIVGNPFSLRLMAEVTGPAFLVLSLHPRQHEEHPGGELRSTNMFSLSTNWLRGHCFIMDLLNTTWRWYKDQNSSSNLDKCSDDATWCYLSALLLDYKDKSSVYYVLKPHFKVTCVQRSNYLPLTCGACPACACYLGNISLFRCKLQPDCLCPGYCLIIQNLDRPWPLDQIKSREEMCASFVSVRALNKSV